MTKYCIVVLPSRFCCCYRFVKAIAHSTVDGSIVAWFTDNFDEALIADTEIEAWFVHHELEVRYPHKDFAVIDVKVCDEDE